MHVFIGCERNGLSPGIWRIASRILSLSLSLLSHEFVNKLTRNAKYTLSKVSQLTLCRLLFLTQYFITLTMKINVKVESAKSRFTLKESNNEN